MLIDLNADFGEGIIVNGQSADAQLIPYITSANIACGAHAGDAKTIRDSIRLCKQHQVRVGAHPGYADRENFGRIETGATPEHIYQLTKDQLGLFHLICREEQVTIHHVKPHGALYHRLNVDGEAALAFLKAVNEVVPHAKIVTFPNSELLRVAGDRGLCEAFVDRTYLPNGLLTPRSEPNAVIHEDAVAAYQALRFAREGFADTLCIHGDSPEAIRIAQATHALLKREDML